MLPGRSLKFLQIAISLFAWVVVTLEIPTPETPDLVNLVVINVDGIGWGDVGVFSPWQSDTPNIDNLAGVILDDLYCETSATASIAAFLTGQLGIGWGLYSSNKVESTQIHEDSGFVLPEDIRLLPRVLQGKGYATKFIGRWNLGQRPKANPTHFGFDEFMGTVSDIPLAASDRMLKPDIGFYQNENIVARIPRDLQPDTSGEETYDFTKLYTEEANVYITRNANEGPFYLHLSLDATKHVPYRSENFTGSSANTRNTTFADALREVDNLVGVVSNALQLSGVAENTVIVFAAQSTALASQYNGGSNSPFSGDSGTTSEGGIRVPGIIKYQADTMSSSRSKLLMNFADLHATVLSLMGINGTPECKNDMCITDGMDLATPLTLNLPAATPPNMTDYVPTRALHAIYRGRTLMAIRTGRYKAHRIVYPYAGSPVLSSLNFNQTSQPAGPIVYDVINDPGEHFPVGPIYSPSSRRFTEVIPELRKEIEHVLETVQLGAGLLNECNIKWREWRPPGCKDIVGLCNPNMPADGQLRMCQSPIWAVG